MLRYIKACENKSWSLRLANKKTNQEWAQGFSCRSWRHEGECRRWKGAQDFVRLKEAMELRGDRVIYIVLTLDQKKYKGDLWKAYKELVDKWDKLNKRMRRRWGKIEYVTLVEQHRSGFPHINILVYNEGLYKACQADKGEGWKKVRTRWLEPNAVESGFGFRTYIEPMRKREAMAGYMVKLCGETAKINQVPVNAPKNFRRLRSSRGFLPPCFKNKDVTGVLVKQPLEILEERMALEQGARTKVVASRDCDLELSVVANALSGSQYVIDNEMSNECGR